MNSRQFLLCFTLITATLLNIKLLRSDHAEPDVVFGSKVDSKSRTERSSPLSSESKLSSRNSDFDKDLTCSVSDDKFLVENRASNLGVVTEGADSFG
jgi:hypothetical protein